jgi:hypothetical protein
MGGFQPLIATAGNGEVAPSPDIRRSGRNRQIHLERSLVVGLGSQCDLGARDVSDDLASSLAGPALRINLDGREA